MQFKVINFEFCYSYSTVFVAFLHVFVKKLILNRIQKGNWICITDVTPKHTSQ